MRPQSPKGQRQQAGDLAIVPTGDPVCLAQARRGRGSVQTFGETGDVVITAEAIVHRSTGRSYARSELAIAGEHNAWNAAAASADAQSAATPDAISGPTKLSPFVADNWPTQTS